MDQISNQSVTISSWEQEKAMALEELERDGTEIAMSDADYRMFMNCLERTYSKQSFAEKVWENLCILPEVIASVISSVFRRKQYG